MSAIRQKANKRILGARVYLWFYNRSNITKDKGIHKYLRSIGEEPAVWEPQASNISVGQIKEYLHGKGYLNAEVKVKDTINLKRRVVNVHYIVDPGQPYTIRSLKYAIEDTSIRQFILSDTINSLIKKQKQPLFDKDLLQQERQRIEYRMRNNGYFRFNVNMMYFEADTAIENKQADIVLYVNREIIKQPNGDTTSIPTKQYKINDVVIRTEPTRSEARQMQSVIRRDTVLKYGAKFIYQDKFWVKPKIIQQSNYLLPGALFRISDVEGTKTHLSSLNVFSVVNTNQFYEINNDTSKYDYLDCHIRLIPNEIQGYTFEIEGSNTSGNIGGAVNFIYEHRSLFGNAENLQVKLRGALEALPETDNKLISRAYEYGVDATLNIPKFLIPFNSMQFKKKYNPKTYITLASNYLHRPDFIRTIMNISFGYNWKGAQYKWHIVTPLDFNYVSVKKSLAFDSLINNTYLENLYTDHLISSSSYSFIYNNQDLKKISDYRYFRWNIESAGNLLQLYNIIGSKDKKSYSESDSIPPHKLFGLRYSQYLKTDFDFHYFHVINKGSGMAYRLFAGIGIPYGNASSLPFEKQYFSGGANSLRGWQVRTLGPGSYVDQTSLKKYPNSTGEIKIEANMEYRFKIVWLLEGALFADIGNIWLLPGSKKPENAVFRWKNFHRQIAVGSGFGTRFNFNYFIFRVDLGIKLRNPAINKWITDYKSITHDDLGLSFAIGYPF